MACLHEAIQDPTASPLLYSGSSSPTQYDELVQVLITWYDRKRLIHKYYSVALANCNSITKGTEDEIRSLVDTAEHNLRGLKDTGQDNLNAFLTSLFELKLSKRLHESWREHSKDTKTVPPIQELLDFLKEKMDALPESATTSARAEHKSEPRKHKAVVHAVQSTPPRNSCSTCNGERHVLYVCPSYRAMSNDDRNSHVRSLNLCINCLGFGHRTRDFRRCKKCSRSHHTTLLKDTAGMERALHQLLPQPRLNRKMPQSTLVVPQPVSQPTLQMISQVILEAPSGKQIVARALLDPGASISLITSRAVQQLQLREMPQSLVISGAQGIHNELLV